MPEFTYEGLRRVVYGTDLVFIPACPKCGRFVRPDESILTKGEGEPVASQNASCARCGRVNMLFEGHVEQRI